ncbi:hypothetical protein OUZ56_018698 [Daphnia magna]|uniref:Retrotransposon gag domain-containing protein n=1 Tax=Daphnia magna TaxID=35525 RepID=A0ABQ9ZA47_9CRUS|nr:hypothetical protein OUZ56_018698 [Daphnia magna]
MAERPMFHYKEPENFRGTPEENAIEWIDRFERIGRHNRWSNNDLARAIDVSLEGAAHKWFIGLEARNAHPEHWEDQMVQVAETDDEPAHYREVRGLKTLFLMQFVAPDMDEEVRIDHLFRGLSPTLYERLYMLDIRSCEEFLEEASLHVDAVKTAYERGYEDARRECEKPAVGAVDLDKDTLREAARKKDPKAACAVIGRGSYYGNEQWRSSADRRNLDWWTTGGWVG